MDTTQFNMHVLHQTNKTTAAIFPCVIDTYNPVFKQCLDNLVRGMGLNPHPVVPYMTSSGVLIRV